MNTRKVEEEELDEVFVNLKVIASLKINTKMSTSGNYLNVETKSYVPESWKRWYRQDNRDETIKKVDRVVLKAINYVESKAEKKDMIVESLVSAKKGLLNLKETYSNCIQTCARLDTVIDKITYDEQMVDASNNTVNTADN